MTGIWDINSYDRLKALSDPRRMQLIRRLMRAPATLSQLGEQVGESAAWVRHHIKVLERHDLVELVGDPPAGGFVEKYYRASASAYLVQLLILPAPGPSGAVHIVGSDDPGLRRLADELNAEAVGPEIQLTPIGSLDGLIALRQGLCQLTACHLYDPAADDFNAPFVRQLFPAQAMSLITFCQRQQGLMVASGNPKRIRGLMDLPRPDLTFVNRRNGSGTRHWLDRELRLQGISPGDVRGYSTEVSTHDAVADAVRAGRADVGLGALASARASGLEFIPLFEERFDLVLSHASSVEPSYARLLDRLTSRQARQVLARVPGYQTKHTGEWTEIE